jgi:hypothetical protein
MKRGTSSEPCSCHGGCGCGCCEGTEPLTPLSIANRPGLDALVYRVGTWSSFLETLKARLSSADFPALSGLTTREANDPSIALLDAWAVVADVLTFYQERIANEGYLRTATERRSVLALARLVGYAVRPGVASSVYLAYTLEEKPKPIPASVPPGSPVAPASASVEEPEILIPRGSRAQSVPGPGELPQPFETSDDLVARAAWNLLPVRLTRPQQPEKLTLATAWPVPLDFSGITTQLQPNAPLLVDIGSVAAPLASLYRVMTVAAEPALDRTRAEVQPWDPEKAAGATFSSTIHPLPVETPASPIAPAVGAILTRASDLETLGISRGATVRRVLSHVETMGTALDANGEDASLQSQIEATLADLRQELDSAKKMNATRLTPWIGQLVADLETVLADLPAADPVSARSLVAKVANEGNLPPGTTRIGDVLGSLGKPLLPPPPRNAQRLPRDLQTLLAPGADLPAKLLALEQPALAAGLYAAWANTPVTPAPALAVYALRTRASVFGHNAPLHLVGREQDGTPVFKEWDLNVVGPGGEGFDVTMSFFAETPGFRLVVAVTLDGNSASTTIAAPLVARLYGVTSPDPKETIDLKLSQIPTASQGGLPLVATIVFHKRQITLDINQQALSEHFQVRSSGATEIAVAVTQTGSGTIEIGIAAEATPAMAAAATAPPPVEATRVLEIHGLRPAGTGELVDPTVVYLDNAYPQITPGDWIVLQRPDRNLNGSPLVIARVQAVSEPSRAAYGIAGKTTRVELCRPDRKESLAWLRAGDDFSVIRGTVVYAQCEKLPLAEEPIPDPVCGGALELAGMYDGLVPGRWLIVAGERTDVASLDPQKNVLASVPGVPAAELVMLAGVAQGIARQSVGGKNVDLAGDRTHTTLTLATPLGHCYKRDSLTIYGNVVHATHGETKAELLGSGYGGKALQSFTLRQPPLTYVSAPTTSGIASTLEMRVNDLLWQEAGCVAALGPTDRGYITRTDDAGATTVVFGDGVHGARLPTGMANVRARYRAGIGRPGNVQAGQISQLSTRPLGVKGVVNPLAATGGGDPESRDQARGNAPLAVMALDRLVSVEDYADFARTFAGVGKASAVRLSHGRVQLVHVTIAGEDDIPILETSDLFLNLGLALRRFGDPRQPIQLALRDRRLLALSAGVRILPDSEWETVEPKIRAALLDAFGYPRRGLGQYAFLAAAYRTIQGVRGVDLADVDVFDGVTGSVDPGELARQAKRLRTEQPRKQVSAHLARVDKQGVLQPAQVVYLSPDAPDTLILKELPS